MSNTLLYLPPDWLNWIMLNDGFSVCCNMTLEQEQLESPNLSHGLKSWVTSQSWLLLQKVCAKLQMNLCFIKPANLTMEIVPQTNTSTYVSNISNFICLNTTNKWSTRGFPFTLERTNLTRNPLPFYLDQTEYMLCVRGMMEAEINTWLPFCNNSECQPYP